MAMDPTDLGQTALVGWREKVAGSVARPVSERTGAGEQQLRAVIGALFFVLSVYYVVSTVRRALDEIRA
jgi:hypothetical protein